MSNFYLILISVSIVLGVTIIMSIIDWLFLHSLSHKITFLELEIEKKTREYDRLRKKIKDSSQDELQETNSEFTQEHPTDQIQASSDQSIKIVRNVRQPFSQQSNIQQTYIQPPQQQSSTFEPTDAPISNQDNTTSTPPHQENYEETHTINVTNAIPTSTHIVNDTQNAGNTNNASINLESDNTIYTPQITTPPPQDECDSDVMDVISDVPQQFQQSDPITLPLFSEPKNDADFENLWHNLSDLLHSKQDARIFIDFSNIQFLYAKELDYLEKICHATQTQGCCIQFVNCDDELIGLINKRPLLLSHLT